MLKIGNLWRAALVGLAVGGLAITSAAALNATDQAQVSNISALRAFLESNRSLYETHSNPNSPVSQFSSLHPRSPEEYLRADLSATIYRLIVDPATAGGNSNQSKWEYVSPDEVITLGVRFGSGWDSVVKTGDANAQLRYASDASRYITSEANKLRGLGAANKSVSSLEITRRVDDLIKNNAFGYDKTKSGTKEKPKTSSEFIEMVYRTVHAVEASYAERFKSTGAVLTIEKSKYLEVFEKVAQQALGQKAFDKSTNIDPVDFVENGKISTAKGFRFESIVNSDGTTETWADSVRKPGSPEFEKQDPTDPHAGH
jgi:hypothetical protein